jgi:hypothetical protein
MSEPSQAKQALSSLSDNPRMKRMEQCKSGRPKSVVIQELNQERDKLNEMHTKINEQRERFLESEAEYDQWAAEWKARKRNRPVDPSEYPFKRHVMDADLVRTHQYQHYVIKALEDELEGREED